MMARGAPRDIQGLPPILQPCLGDISTETFFPALLESFRIQYLQFLAYTKTPQYKASLQQLLDQEKVRATSVCVPSILQRALFPVTSPCQRHTTLSGLSGGTRSLGMLSPSHIHGFPNGGKLVSQKAIGLVLLPMESQGNLQFSVHAYLPRLSVGTW